MAADLALRRKLKAKCLQWEKAVSKLIRALELQKSSGIRGPRNLWSQGSEQGGNRKVGWKSVLGAVRLLGPSVCLVLYDSHLFSTPAEDWRYWTRGTLVPDAAQVGVMSHSEMDALTHTFLLLNSEPLPLTLFPIQLWECWDQDFILIAVGLGKILEDSSLGKSQESQVPVSSP